MKRRGFFGALLGAAAAPIAAKVIAELPSEPASLVKAFPAPSGSERIEGATIYKSSYVSAYSDFTAVSYVSDRVPHGGPSRCDHCGRLNGYIWGDFRANCEGCGAPL